MQEKYGFVYIWYDKKRKMYYIGCHWGTEDDGYICSNHRMLDNYKRRPNDFKRKILERVEDRTKLFWNEACWLWFIEPDELGQKYYNVCRNPIHHWSADPEKKLTVGQKISKRNTGRIQSEEEKQKRGKTLRDKYASGELIAHTKGTTHSKERNKKQSETFKKRIAQMTPKERKERFGTMKNQTLPEETKKKIAEANRMFFKTNRRKREYLNDGSWKWSYV